MSYFFIHPDLLLPTSLVILFNRQNHVRLEINTQLRTKRICPLVSLECITKKVCSVNPKAVITFSGEQLMIVCIYLTLIDGILKEITLKLNRFCFLYIVCDSEIIKVIPQGNYFFFVYTLFTH